MIFIVWLEAYAQSIFHFSFAIALLFASMSFSLQGHRWNEWQMEK
jgi:hypothetical protein